MNRTPHIYPSDHPAGRHKHLWQVWWTPMQRQMARARLFDTGTYGLLCWEKEATQ